MKQFFARRDFALLWSGHTVSSLGTWIDYVVLNLYVYNLFGSASVLGSFLVVRLLPALLFGPLGGYLADRFPRRTLLVCCDAIRAVLVLGFLVVREIPAFFALGLALAALDKVHQAAQGAFIPDLVDDKDLLEANGMFRVSTSVTTVIGPATGALLVSSWGFPVAFILDSATFGFSAVATLLIRSGRRGAEDQDAPGSNSRPDYRVALGFLAGSPALLYLLAIRFMDSLGSGAYMTGLPIFASSLDARQGASYGWLIGVWALGTLWGSLGMARWARTRHLPLAPGFAGAVLLMAAGMAWTFHARSLVPAMLAIFIGGVGDGLSGLLFQTTLMRTAPPAVRGRVIGSSLALLHGGAIAGMAAAGPFIERFPLRAVTDASSILIALSAVIGFLVASRHLAMLEVSASRPAQGPQSPILKPSPSREKENPS